MKKILKYNGFKNEKFFNKLPNFEFNGKVKKITFTLNGDKIEALSSAWSGYEQENDIIEFKNNFHFRTDKKNTLLLKKNDISKIEFIDPTKKVITFIKNDDSKISCKFKVKYFSKKDINWDTTNKDEYVTWRM